jgi:hypothetical protein
MKQALKVFCYCKPLNSTVNTITDFRLSWWLIIDVNSVLGLLHFVDVGNIAGVSEVRAASIFRVEACQLVNFCVYIAFCF